MSRGMEMENCFNGLMTAQRPRKVSAFLSKTIFLVLEAVKTS
jgi:hypothetical protein